MARRSPVRALSLLCMGVFLLLPQVCGAQDLSRPASTFAAMTCQQLWYLEGKVLSEARVCPSSGRARQAFRNAPACLSDSETILPAKVRDYLVEVRRVASDKGCPSR